MAAMRKLVVGGMVVLSMCGGMGAAGCAAIPVITQIASIVIDAMTVLQIIDGAANEWFRNHPNTPAKVRSEYAQLMRDAMEALNAAQKALAGVEDLDQQQYDEAFAKFREAYAKLRQIMERQGIVKGDYLRASAEAEPVYVPREPMALTHRVQ